MLHKCSHHRASPAALERGFSTLFALKSCLVHVEAADAMAVAIKVFDGKSLLWQALPCHMLHKCSHHRASPAALEKVSPRSSPSDSCLVHVEAADALAVVLKFLWEKLALAGLAMTRAAQVLASSSKSRSVWRRFLHALRPQILPCAC